MATQYMENQGFKKKYLAPLIVLMLCAVSLTGAAYAYSTTVQGNGYIDHDYYSIDLYTDATGKQVIDDNTYLIKANKDFDVSTTKIAGKNYHANVTADTLTITTYLKVQSNETEDCTIAGTAKYTVPETGTADMYKGWADAVNGVKCTVNAITEPDGSSVSQTKTNHMYMVTITVVLPAISDVDLGSTNPADVPTLTQFASYILITFTATEKTTATPSP